MEQKIFFTATQVNLLAEIAKQVPYEHGVKFITILQQALATTAQQVTPSATTESKG